MIPKSGNAFLEYILENMKVQHYFRTDFRIWNNKLQNTQQTYETQIIFTWIFCSVLMAKFPCLQGKHQNSSLKITFPERQAKSPLSASRYLVSSQTFCPTLWSSTWHVNHELTAREFGLPGHDFFNRQAPSIACNFLMKQLEFSMPWGFEALWQPTEKISWDLCFVEA